MLVPLVPRGGGKGRALSQGSRNDTCIRTLGPSWKRELKARRVFRTTPLDNGTVITPTFPAEVVSPDSCGTCESVSMRVVSAIDHLPIKIPTSLRSLPKPVVNVSSLFSSPKPRLRRSVPNYRDAITNQPGPESTAVCAPMLPSQGGQKRQRKSTCMGFRNYGRIITRGREDRPRNAGRRATAVNVPQERTGPGC